VLPLSGTGKPLIRETLDRVRPLAQDVLVVTEQRQLSQIAQLVPELGEGSLLVEPSARGTTNAMGLAAMALAGRDPDAVMLWLAADHVVRGERGYRQAVERAVRVAESSCQLVALGLKPAYPATGFGYIEAGDPVRTGRAHALRVARFVEKPTLERAEEFLRSGRHYWNLSMFCCRCDVFLEELRRHGPEHYTGLQDVHAARAAGDEERAASLYAALPSEAVDYTVMERTDRLLLVPASFQWSDVGSWTDLAALVQGDEDGNVVEGASLLIDVQGSFISVPDKLVAVIGCQELVVVDTDDALLICPKSRAQDVKQVVQHLERSGKTRYL
jgi:mannose-1-phosphate guanylyltransferase